MNIAFTGLSRVLLGREVLGSAVFLALLLNAPKAVGQG